MKSQPIVSISSLPPAKNVRPLSNPHVSSLNIKKEDALIFNQHINSIINDLINKRKFSHNDKRRSQLGSAPSQSNNINEKVFKYNNKTNDCSGNSNINITNIRQLHKIKIERGLASSTLIERFSKGLSNDYTNDFTKNTLSTFKSNSNNEPIKIIKM